MNRRGQLLLEILIAIAVGAVVLSLGAGLIYVSLNGAIVSVERNVALGIADFMIESIRTAAYENWNTIDAPPLDSTGDFGGAKGSGIKYYPQRIYDNGYASIILDESATASSDRWDTTDTINATSSIGNVTFLALDDGSAWVSRAPSSYESDGDILETRHNWEIIRNPGGSLNFVTVLEEHDDANPSNNTYYGLFVGDGEIAQLWNDSNRTMTSLDVDAVLTPNLRSAAGYDDGVIVAGGGSGATTKIWETTDIFASTPVFTAWASSELLSGTVNSATPNGIAPSSTIWVVGSSGLVARISSTLVVDDCTDDLANVNFNSVSASTSTNVWVVGDSGNVWQNKSSTGCSVNSNNWVDRSATSPTDKWGSNTNILSVRASSTGSAIIAGDNGEVWAYDGSSWTQICGNGYNDDEDHANFRDCDETYTNTVRWGTANMRVSESYSSQIWIVGSGGKVFKQSSQRVEIRTGEGTVDDYAYYFYIANICRDDPDVGDPDLINGFITGFTDSDGADETCVESTGTYDPTTLSIAAEVTWPRGGVSKIDYITRWPGFACTFVAVPTAETTSTTRACPRVAINDILFDTSSSSFKLLPLIGNAILTSPVIDLMGLRQNDAADNGVFLHSFLWEGTEPSGSSVRFIFATSDCTNGATNPPTCNSGSWTNYDGGETSCASGDFISNYKDINSGTVSAVTGCSNQFGTKRYLRIQMNLTRTDPILGTSPEVTEFKLYFLP
ncbi:MAG: hypothetical protein HYS87_02580 [Candidatus Colwellbacteria bacterium]|nr:hypothetical protein [Candidatus Colwellbacteria bacterium]